MADDMDDCDKGLAGLSPEFQAMVGGLAGHTASFAKILERRTKQMSKEDAKNKDDEVYLESYADLAIHEDMLKDGPRVEAYRKALEQYGSEKWKAAGDVTVVDVGAGTGLLSIFAARAGAKRVYAVEASRLAYYTKAIVEKNTPPGVVEVKECRAEALELEEGKKVDVIVSEWMGYFLLFENMLPSVLAVRDRYLRPGGLMLPSACRLMVAPFQDNSFKNSKLEFWKDVHGIDMSALAPLATATICGQGQHRQIDPSALIGQPMQVLELDLHTCREKDLKSFESPMTFNIPAGKRLDGFATWFECEFGEAGWLLSTDPKEPATHWRQTSFHLRQPIEGGGGIAVEAHMSAETHEEFSRGYRVTFEIKAPGRKRREESFEIR